MPLFIPITKVDVAQRLVYGVATAELPDRSGEICDYETTKPLYEKWSQEFDKVTDGKSLGNVRAMHGNVAAGKLTSILFNDEGKQIEICAKVVDDNEWKKVEEGVYTGFSQGGNYAKRWKDKTDPKLMRYTAQPSEVSLVDLPCLPDATFSVIKADGSTEMRKFHKVEEPAAEPTEGEQDQADAKKASDDADTASSEADEKDTPTAHAAAADAHAKAKEANTKAGNKKTASTHGKLAAYHSAKAKETMPAEETPAEKAARALALRKALDNPDITNGDVAQLAAAHLPEADRVGTPEELLERLDKVAAPAAPTVVELRAALVAKPAGEVLAGLVKRFISEAEQIALTDDEKRLEALTKIAARDDATPADKSRAADQADSFADEKNKKYKLDTVAQIKAAWSYINMPKNAKKYDAEDVKTIKAKIVAAWKKKIDKDGPPSAEKFAAALGLQKGYVCTPEGQWINTGLSAVSSFAYLVQSIWDSARQCALEQEYEGDTESQVPAMLEALAVEAGEILCQMVEEEVGEESDKAQKVALLGDLRKQVVGDKPAVLLDLLLAKYGARHSKTDKDRLQKIHDHSVEMGAECGDDAEKAVAPEGLRKALGLKDNATAEQVSKAWTAVVEKAAAYDKLPARPKGALKVISKGQDVAGDVAELPEELEELIKKAQGGDTHAAMRLSQMRPLNNIPHARS